MKKILALMLAMLMVLALAACGSSSASAPAEEPAAEEAAPAEAPAAEEAPAEEPAEAPAEEAPAETRSTFIMGIDPEYPPFSYLGDDGEYTGFDVEICQAACDYLGWDMEIFGVNWDQKLIQLDNNECDCVWSGMTILDSMYDAGYVISAPYYDNTQVLVVKEDSGITSASELEGKYVAVQLGTSGEALLAEDGDLADLAATFGELVTCDSFLKCFTELEGNSVDAVFVDLPVAFSYAAEHEGLLIINEQLGAEQYGIAFRSGDEDLCAQIEGAVAALVENGAYAEIAAKYPDIVNNLLFLSE